MGQLEQFAKQLFEEETAALTAGAIAWGGPVELGLSEVRLDGRLRLLAPDRLAALAAPWSLAAGGDEVVIELKLPGDHLDPVAVARALLRRQAYDVVRLEAARAAGAPPGGATGPVPLWLVAPHRPRWLPAGAPLAPGCERLGHAPFTFLWVAANELPLRDELVPFLAARSGAPLDAFARWVLGRRPAAWVLRMLQFLPMSTAAQDEILRAFPKTDDPEVRARRRRIAQVLLEDDPELLRALPPSDDPEVRARRRRIAQVLLEDDPGVGAELVERGVEQGLAQLYERRLARPLTEAERRTLHERLGRLGAVRLGDVLLAGSAEALAAWLADPAAR